MELNISKNHYVVEGWMIQDLGLKGAKLTIFAIIYGFSQDQTNVFNGNIKYLETWTGCTERGVLKALKELLDSEYIVKEKNTGVGRGKYTYKVSPKCLLNIEK